MLRQLPRGQQAPSTAANPSSHTTGQEVLTHWRHPHVQVQGPPQADPSWGQQAVVLEDWWWGTCCAHKVSPSGTSQKPLLSCPSPSFGGDCLGSPGKRDYKKKQENPLGSYKRHPGNLTPSMSEIIRDLNNFTKFAHTHWVKNFVISCYYYILLYSATKPSLKIRSSCREARETGWVLSLLTAVLHIIPASPTDLFNTGQPCTITWLRAIPWVSTARKDFFSDMQCHVQKIDWNPNRTALFSFLLPNLESIGGFIVGTVLLIELYHSHAEIWFIFPMLQNSWLNKGTILVWMDAGSLI